MDYYEFEDEPEWQARARDPAQDRARSALIEFFDKRREEVFFSRQLEVMLEKDLFHWITNRALNELVAEGFLMSEQRSLGTGGTIKLLWHSSYRYYKRAARRVVSLVEEYADPNIGGALGLHGEMLVLEGFARERFLLLGKEVRAHEGGVWSETDHDLDFLFERDGQVYGVEVKNKLGYMDRDELLLKLRLSRTIGVTPVIVARMLPKTWIEAVRREGGFSLILKWQLYPWSHRTLARRVHEELGLPVDAPRALEEGTVKRFLKWHAKRL